ncbi:MAG: hypothetical protein IPN95_30950 [Bacteroidetes bacterium]|nr:hypothetical protein [Bacteroidota bacterium]MBP6722541.1 hypothetical protein [Bacteroidia bacterium]
MPSSRGVDLALGDPLLPRVARQQGRALPGFRRLDRAARQPSPNDLLRSPPAPYRKKAMQSTANNSLSMSFKITDAEGYG